MRWLIEKDARILRRSPLLVGLLVLYPIVIALLIGFSISGGPAKPRVAFANLVAPEDNDFSIAGEQLDASRYADELFRSIDPIVVDSRAEAIEKVRSGEALGALIVPADITRRLQQAINLSGSAERPTVEVIYNAEDPVKRRFVESTINARLADANKALSERLTKIAADYLQIVLRGGDFSLLGRRIEVLGLERSRALVESAIAALPPNSPLRTTLAQVSGFSRVAIDNLDLSDEVLTAVSSPVAVKQTVLDGDRTPLDAFAVAVSVAISLMFVTVLLAAGLLALEREEHTFSRVVRGVVGRTRLLGAKVLLAATCALGVTFTMLAGLSAFVTLGWGRVGWWVLALAAGALAFAAMGVAIGALAREVRAASLLAFLLALPVAFLALVPSGSVSPTLFDVIRTASALFPFKPSLQALDAAINDADPGIWGPLAHLAALLAAYGTLARLALRRFA